MFSRSDYLSQLQKNEPNMGIQAETREEVRKEMATKLFGQPTANNLTQL
jgi:hypothetical protein